MRDNLRQYRAIWAALTQGYPGEPQGRCAWHLATLAALISGIVASTRTHLPQIAAKVPDGTTPESRVKRCARWVDNDTITAPRYLLLYADGLLMHLAWQRLVLVIDGRVVGRGGVALMLHVVYKGRALPLVWQVRKGKQGHCPETLHIALGEPVPAWIPVGASGVLLGEGACDGTGLPQTLADAGGSSVCRTGCHMTAAWPGATFRRDTLGTCLRPGRLVAFAEARFTEAAYGPMMVLCWWAKGYKDPLYLVTNRAVADEACRVYAKRFRIEIV